MLIKLVIIFGATKFFYQDEKLRLYHYRQKPQ